MNRMCVTGALLTSFLILSPAAPRAQEVSVPAIKAGFLLNFMKFAEWPVDAVPPGQSFTFCIAGDRAVLQILRTNVHERPNPEPLSIMFVTVDGPFQTCDLLYLSSMDLRQARRIIDSLKASAVFTVGDTEGFAEMGGVAQLRIVKGQMRFAINPASAHRARIALSAKLLTLATLVKDGFDDYR